MAHQSFLIRTQLALAMLSVLALFALNLAAGFWAQDRREGALSRLRVAADRRAQVIAVERTLDERWSEMRVLRHLELSDTQVDQLRKRLEVLRRDIESLRTGGGPDDARAIDELTGAYEVIRAAWCSMYEGRRAPAAGPGNDTGDPETDPRFAPAARAQATKGLTRLVAAQERRAEAAAVEFQEISALSDRLSLTIFGVSLVLAALVAVLLWRRLGRGMALLKGSATRLSAGDMSHRIVLEQRDELGDVARAFNGMADHLQAALAEAGAAREAADRANRAKSTFLNSITHELRTPMTSILGYTELIGEAARVRNLEGIVEDARQVERSGQHMLALVNDLLDLARIESGRATLCVEAFEIGPMLHEVAAAVQPQAHERNDRIDVVVPAGIGSMEADPIKVRQILLNLAGNAVKFTGEGVITLSAAQRGRGASERIVLGVRDTGIGIDPRHLERIFDEYEQADATVGRTYGGTGLGLALVKRCCEMMGGRVSVTSSQGQGTTFLVELPRVVDVSDVRDLSLDGLSEPQRLAS